MILEVLVGVAAAAVAGAVAARVASRAATGRAAELLAAGRAEAQAIRRAAEREVAATIREMENAAREQALELRESVERELTAREENLARRDERARKTDQAVEEETAERQARAEAVATREREAQSRHDRARGVKGQLDKLDREGREALEALAGVTAREITAQLAESWIEDARAAAAQTMRSVETEWSGAELDRQAKRVMGIAVQRYHAHFLTERLVSNVSLMPGMAEMLSKDGNALLDAMAEASGVKLELHDTGEKVRLDSGDGIAKEVVRRALSKLAKGTAPKNALTEPKVWVKQLAGNLEKEIVDLGRRAFSELGIPKAHPDIVRLVGALNWRTSYTQNQWKHALEASFLGGMMAAELGLDVKLARRATLMHDIGKALTHEIDGSHAVIGADLARKLGEAEIVANAIGAHHADEPPNSVYAYLVAAADAMSGARPGARREQTEQYSTRLEDLERIGVSYRGVENAYAVQGGRELRVYVDRAKVDDLRAVELSSEIAARISEEMTFPGQIKVTVIRAVEAVEIAN